jgi:predicted short-subunit dehydrogenase-like oxidoreductase (DUF2520 family)
MSSEPGMHDQTIILAGTGNLAWHWPDILAEAALHVAYVYGRNPMQTKALADRAGAFAVTDVKDLPTAENTLVILAVSDQAITDVARELQAPGRYLVHCSGSIPAAAVSGGGVFYPLQTFSRNRRPIIQDIPFYVTTDDDQLARLLFQLGKMINGKVERISDEQRLYLHLAAVIANNFSNHLLRLADDFLRQKDLSYQALIPLMQETVAKLTEMNPAEAQTGPAKRGDAIVIDKHMDILKNHPELQNVYTLLTNSIRDKHFPA